MIDASKGFMKDGNKNRLRSQDIHKIVDAFNRQYEIDRYSRMVSLAEIEANDFNLNIPRYIDSSEPEDMQDIEAHLRGGIPVRDIDGLDEYWQVFPNMRASLFDPVESRSDYRHLKMEPADVKSTIFDHPEFKTYNESITALFEKWKAGNIDSLRRIKVGDKPKALIEACWARSGPDSTTGSVGAWPPKPSPSVGRSCKKFALGSRRIPFGDGAGS